MNISVGALIDDPGVSTEAQITANFIDLIKTIFEQDFINTPNKSKSLDEVSFI